MFRGDFRDWRFYIFLAFCLLILPIPLLLFAGHMVKLTRENRKMQRIADTMRRVS